MIAELKPIEELREGEQGYIADPFYALGELRSAKSGYQQIHGLQACWDSLIPEAHAVDRQAPERAWAELERRVTEGAWVLVYDEIWPPLIPALEEVKGGWVVDKMKWYPQARRRLENWLRRIAHDHQQKEYWTQHWPVIPAQGAPADDLVSGPGARPMTLGPHAGAPVVNDKAVSPNTLTPAAAVLKFDDNDMVYGPSAHGELVKLRSDAGGKLLSDVLKANDKDVYSDFGGNWKKASQWALEQQVQNGGKIHFDLTYVDDLEGVLRGTAHQSSITTFELQYIKSNWDRFQNSVKFYNKGNVVMPW